MTPILLLDQSASMQPSNSPSWPQVAARLRALTGAASAQVVRFGRQPLPVAQIGLSAKLPPSPPIDNQGTNIEAALELALAHAAPGQPIFLCTDGIETAGNATSPLERAAGSGHPVFSLGAEERRRSASARLVDVQLPGIVGAGAGFAAVAHIFSTVSQPATLDVLAGKRLVASQRVELKAGATTRHGIALTAPAAGALTLEFRLTARDDNTTEDNTVTKIIDAAGKARVLYVSAARDTPLQSALSMGGWQVTHVSPSRLTQDITGGANVVVLDNVAAGDAPDTAWQRLGNAVSDQGTGLIVLGGNNAFGAGNYRGSVLEDLLPVTAQSGRPIDPISVVFLLDQSGSMDKPVGRTSRFNYARQAILRTAGELSHDEIGVTVFDTDARVLLPLGRYPDPARAIAAAWNRSRPAGGTILTSGIRSAIDQLRKATTRQRILMVVTDGFSADDNLDASLDQIARLGIDVIALAVGADADPRLLKRMTALNTGAFLTLDDETQIPAIMESALGARRLTMEASDIRPVETRPLPFDESKGPWPPLLGYMVTRARNDATVFLASPRHDPLLASWQYGLGTVLALPAGLDDFAPGWLSWPGWSAFAGGLIEWAAGAANGSSAHIAIIHEGRDVRLRIDAIDAAGEWRAAPPALPAILTPVSSGSSREFEIPRVAPGRYSLRLPLETSGAYRLGIRIGNREQLRHFYYAAPSEWASRKSSLDAWYKAGLVRQSSDFQPVRGVHMRNTFAILALVLYGLGLATLISQRRNLR